MTKSNGWINSIYESYDELSMITGTYDNSEWIKKQILRVENFEKEKEISILRNSLLIDSVNKIKNENVSILDYGGGFGLSYMPLAYSTQKILKYHIVEVPGVSVAASEFYSSNSDIFFHSSFSNIEKIDYDIAYIRTSLQYAKDWKGVLKSITSLRPEKIILSDASIGNIKTFLTFQLWGSEKIPYWFINENELIESIVNEDYTVLKREIARDISEDKSWSTQREYPEEHRIDSLVNIIFKKR